MAEASGGARRVADRGGQQDGNRNQKQEQERLQDEHRGRDDEGLRARLGKLSNALDAHREAAASSDAAKPEQGGVSPGGSMGKAISLAVRVLSEFVAAVLVGAVMGWWIDRAAGTSPAFLIVFLFMGAAAGFWNVYRIAMKPPDLEG